MIRPLSLSELAQRCGGTLFYPDCRFDGVSTDSRTLKEGELFVALRGEHFDAHDFLETVALKAAGMVVEFPSRQLNVPQWVVPDTTAALGKIANMARDDFAGKLIGLTGSSGKTTVKEMIAAIVGQLGPTLATRGNLNNHIGVPLTLLDIKREHRYAVIEMGASGPGEIAYLADMARPDVALVNNVMPAHVGGFGSLNIIADTKGAIYQSLPASGVAVIPKDEPWAESWRSTLPCTDCLTFSLTDTTADFYASGIELKPEGGSTFKLVSPAGSCQIELPLAGEHNVTNSLAAAACAFAAGATLEHIRTGLSRLEPIKGRLVILGGRNGAKVLDDTYNANPGSVQAAIDVLAGYKGLQFLVLGDMAELGDEAGVLHREVGAYAQNKGISQLWAVGVFARELAEGFGAGARVFADKQALVQALSGVMSAETTVLVKGSRSAGMEEIVHQITEDKSDASMVG